MHVIVEASAISDAVEAEFRSAAPRATVHSVFHRATNILLNGRLVTICHEECGVPPNGITVTTKTSFLQLGLAPGQRVAVDHGRLRMPGAGCLIDLSSARAWSPRLAQVSSAIDMSRRQHNLSAAREALVAAEDQHPRSAEFWTAKADSMTRLIAAVPLSELRSARQEAATFLGLGPGLTPAGDDFLLGFVAALWIECDPIAAGLAEAVARMAIKKTTLLAATFHDYAARHLYASPLHGLLRHLLWGAPGESSAAVERTLRMGATSGADTLRGILSRIRARGLAF